MYKILKSVYSTKHGRFHVFIFYKTFRRKWFRWWYITIRQGSDVHISPFSAVHVFLDLYYTQCFSICVLKYHPHAFSIFWIISNFLTSKLKASLSFVFSKACQNPYIVVLMPLAPLRTPFNLELLDFII